MYVLIRLKTPSEAELILDVAQKRQLLRFIDCTIADLIIAIFFFFGHAKSSFLFIMFIVFFSCRFLFIHVNVFQMN